MTSAFRWWWFLSLRADDQLPARRNTLRQVETYEVERQQFDSIEGEATVIGTAFSLACACLPVAVTLNVTLVTVPIKGEYTAVGIWGLAWACYILGACFAIVAFRQRGKLKGFMQQIREAQVAPVAAKTQQVEPDLTSVADPSATPFDINQSLEADEH